MKYTYGGIELMNVLPRYLPSMNKKNFTIIWGYKTTTLSLKCLYQSRKLSGHVYVLGDFCTQERYCKFVQSESAQIFSDHKVR